MKKRSVNYPASKYLMRFTHGNKETDKDVG